MSPTEIDFYSEHTDEAVQAVADRYAEISLSIATAHGSDHPLAVEALAISVAATGQLIVRNLFTLA